MQVLSGRFEQFDATTTERLCRASTFEWPHAFARFDAPVEEMLARFGANHIHVVPGDRSGGVAGGVPAAGCRL